MLISTATGCLSHKLGYRDTLCALKDAGFDGYDFGAGFFCRNDHDPMMQDDYMDLAQEFKKLADSLGMVCVQAHATYPPEKYGDEKYNRETFQKILRQMEVSAYLGARDIVVHAVKPLPREVSSWDENFRFYKSLEPWCEKFGIRVAVENLYQYDDIRGHYRPCPICTPQRLAEFVDALDSPWFSVCLDTGHAAMNGDDPEDAIAILGKRISVIHIHDNNYREDNHYLPYLGRINWENVCKALADIGFRGAISVETDRYEGKFPKELIPAALEFEVKVLRHLANTVERFANI